MTYRGATFLGVGSMVGAGIFALLGEAGAVAGAATWLSFALAGGIALLLGYVVVTLGRKYPSSAGFIEYLRQGFGSGHLLGVGSWLMYFALIIVTAMVAVSFGEYAAALVIGDDASELSIKLLAVAVIALMTAVNVSGSSLVDRAQSVIVVAVLGVFAVFIVSTVGSIDSDNLATSTYPGIGDIIASVALTYFAYLGFAVITFSAGDLEHPERDLGRATFTAIGIATLTYVLVAIGVFGVLGTDEVISSGTTAIAEAARPALGDFGFTLMTITAMLATAGCTNANLYAASHLTRSLGTSGEFPESFARDTRRGRPAGLMLTAAVTVVMASAFDLTAIASIGTVVALTLFFLLCIAGLRLREHTGAKVLPIGVAMIAIVGVLGVFLVTTIQDDPGTVVAMAGVGALAVLCEWWFSRERARAQLPT